MTWRAETAGPPAFDATPYERCGHCAPLPPPPRPRQTCPSRLLEAPPALRTLQMLRSAGGAIIHACPSLRASVGPIGPLLTYQTAAPVTSAPALVLSLCFLTYERHGCSNHRLLRAPITASAPAQALRPLEAPLLPRTLIWGLFNVANTVTSGVGARTSPLAPSQSAHHHHFGPRTPYEAPGSMRSLDPLPRPISPCSLASHSLQAVYCIHHAAGSRTAREGVARHEEERNR